MAITTVKDDNEARKIVDAVLQKRLAACANIISGVQSRYWWRDKIETRSERIIFFKTRKHLTEKLRDLVLINHSSDIAEFIVVPIIGGSMHYFSWIDQEVERISD